MKHTVYLLLGSNKGDRFFYLSDAICRLRSQRVSVSVEFVSSVYLSSPWGEKYQKERYFLNQVVAISTALSPLSLLKELLFIEQIMGRDRTCKNLSRLIDIDILMFGNQVISHPRLCVPHALMEKRRFALSPFAEIAPHVIHPVLHQSIFHLLRSCSDSLGVVLYNPK